MAAVHRSFVVRIWEEPRDNAGAERLCRGSVEDVRAGTRVYFSSLLELCQQLEEQTGMPWSPAQRATLERRPTRRR